MENYDAAMAQRVWQRVRGEETAHPGLQALAAAERSEAAVYLILSKVLQNREKLLLRQIFTQEQEHAACLRGIHFLTIDKPLALRTVPPASEPPEITLRKSYGRKLRALQEYESRASDPEYGPAFAHMARQEREHCVLILQILGRLRG